ncbi:hypothetical protein ACGC1H_003913 [Rhizoctonia solani]
MLLVRAPGIRDKQNSLTPASSNKASSHHSQASSTPYLVLTTFFIYSIMGAPTHSPVMGGTNHTLVRCTATAPNRDTWFNALLWIISLFQLLISIGREVLSPSPSLIRQIRQPISGRLPSISRPTQVNSAHRVSSVSSEPSSRGPGAKTNDSAIEASSSALPSSYEQVALRTPSRHTITHDAGPSQPNASSSSLTVFYKPITRLLLYGANNEGNVFNADMMKFARACRRHLGSHSRVEDRISIGEIGLEFQMFFSQTNVRIQDMFIFGASGHGRIGDNLVTFCLSTNINIRIRDIFMVINHLPFHCTIEVFLDMCHAAMAAEQHGLYKIWPSDDLLSTFNLRDGALRPRTGPKVIVWTAAGRQGVAYFTRGKDSYMLSAICKILTNGPNITRRELYRRIMVHLESLNETLRQKNIAPQIPVIFSSVPDRDHVLDGYALQPLLLTDAPDIV